MPKSPNMWICFSSVDLPYFQIPSPGFRSKAFRRKSCVGECATVTQRLLLVFQDTRWKLPQYIFSPKVCVRWQGWATQWSESYCLGWNPKRVIQWQLRYKSWITSGFPTESCVILWYNLLVMRFHLLTAITCRLQQDHLGFKVGRPCQQISFAATWLWFPMPLLCWWMVKRMSGDLSSWADGDQSVRCLVWFGRFHVNRCINKYICIYTYVYTHISTYIVRSIYVHIHIFVYIYLDLHIRSHTYVSI